jgi:hypothetical protein
MLLPGLHVHGVSLFAAVVICERVYSISVQSLEIKQGDEDAFYEDARFGE